MFNKFSVTTRVLFFLLRTGNRKIDWLNSHLLPCKRPAKGLQKSTFLYLDPLVTMNGLIFLSYPQ